MLPTLLLTSTLALGVLGQSASSSAPPSSAETSINLFLGPEGDSRIKWEASVIGVDEACMTTFGLTCTKGKACKGGVSATITEGQGIYELSTVTAVQGVTQDISERCVLAGTGKASCTVEIAATSGTSTKSTSTAKVFRGGAVVFEQVPVTAGASLLASGTCSSAVITGSASSGAAASGSASSGASRSGGGFSGAGSSGAPSASSSGTSQESTGTGSGSGAQSTGSTSTGTGAAPTSFPDVYKVLVVPAAALLAFV